MRIERIDQAILQRKANCEQIGTLNLEQVEHVFGIVEHLKGLDLPAVASLLLALEIVMDIRDEPEVVQFLDQARVQLGKDSDGLDA